MAEVSAQVRRAEAERYARSQIATGRAGADVLAHLLDVIDVQRDGHVGPWGGAYSVWERAAGFADEPELAS